MFNNTCQCLPDWTGKYCELKLHVPTSEVSVTDKLCSLDCLNGGACFNDSCVCASGYGGLFCENKKGKFICVCSGISSNLILYFHVKLENFHFYISLFFSWCRCL